MIALKHVFLALFLIVIVIVLFSLFVFYISIKPEKWPVLYTPDSFNLRYENITFETTDGLRLKGWFVHGSGNKTIIVMHGYPTNKADVLPFSMFLLKKFNVLLFDFRSFGESEGTYTTAGYKEVKDLDAAVSFLKTRNDSEKIGALGFSLGASVAIMSSNPKIQAIVADSPYSNLNNMIESMYRHFFVFKHPFVYLTRLYSKIFFGVDTKDVNAEEKIKHIDNILIIHGKNDKQIPVKESYTLHNANNKAELWIVNNAGHGEIYAFNKEEYESRVLDFFEKHLK
jgi:uncharacterized protein